MTSVQGHGFKARIDRDGQGYRVYFARKDVDVFVLLTGGDKASQRADIEESLVLARELRGSR